ncbi:uncharacterized protein LOC133341879 isoform X2 [Lethenteron reissneri]|uniref:uncharacterized protein LOC133341879 isoform X2 n=1 Tax=Lethenteron reissneri TaxID=7753 RepID=UPI002AB7DEED|nr:uncharacterized protein LOC133341879 isoform X2 [Lethenteron reissneri]
MQPCNYLPCTATACRRTSQFSAATYELKRSKAPSFRLLHSRRPLNNGMERRRCNRALITIPGGRTEAPMKEFPAHRQASAMGGVNPPLVRRCWADCAACACDRGRNHALRGDDRWTPGEPHRVPSADLQERVAPGNRVLPGMPYLALCAVCILLCVPYPSLKSRVSPSRCCPGLDEDTGPALGGSGQHSGDGDAVPEAEEQVPMGGPLNTKPDLQMNARLDNKNANNPYTGEAQVFIHDEDENQESQKSSYDGAMHSESNASETLVSGDNLQHTSEGGQSEPVSVHPTSSPHPTEDSAIEKLGMTSTLGYGDSPATQPSTVECNGAGEEGSPEVVLPSPPIPPKIFDSSSRETEMPPDAPRIEDKPRSEDPTDHVEGPEKELPPVLATHEEKPLVASVQLEVAPEAKLDGTKAEEEPRRADASTPPFKDDRLAPKDAESEDGEETAAGDEKEVAPAAEEGEPATPTEGSSAATTQHVGDPAGHAPRPPRRHPLLRRVEEESDGGGEREAKSNLTKR